MPMSTTTHCRSRAGDRAHAHAVNESCDDLYAVVCDYAHSFSDDDDDVFFSVCCHADDDDDDDGPDCDSRFAEYRQCW